MADAAQLPPEAQTPPVGGPGPGPGPGRAEGAEGTEGLFVVLGAGLAAASHPLLYVKLLVQVGHEPLPPTIGRNVLGKKVLYLPGFFTYARHIVKVDGRRGLFRGLTPRLISSTLSTITRGSVKKAFPLEDMEHVSNKDDMKTSLRKVVKETSHEMMMQCVSRVVSHPLHAVCSVPSSGYLRKKGFWDSSCTGVVPHILGDVIFLWCCNLLAHFINTYAVDDNFSQASVIRSYTKFVMGIAMSMLTYPFLLVGDLMAVNNCGLRAGLPPYAPVFTSWIHCWRYLSAQAVVPEQDTLQQGLQQVDLQRSGFRLQLDQSPILMAALTRAHRRVVCLVWAVSLESLRKSGKPENAQVLNEPEMLGQKTALFCLS
ncbi:mitochondrial carrier homolog 1 isoform X3 [Cygnus atratus]|uniref:mitochondrial carrier homolog 1 isoform X3 n=1 Tax=Cygnus atratus TaxID=8868 RepID=UPI0021B6EC9C|nr:mitochondrial carrier homolog 1 isoform X3 [Cygnus atratus]